MAWYQHYLQDPKWLSWYSSYTHRKYQGVIDDLDDLAAEALARLCEKLPTLKPKNQDNLDGLVRTIFKRLLIDRMREITKRPRPPTRLKAIGPPVESIFELHCLDGLHTNQIAQELRLRLDVVKYWVGWLNAERKCPERAISVPYDELDDANRHVSLPADDALDPTGDDAERSELIALLRLLLDVPSDSDAEQNMGKSTISNAMKSLCDRVREALAGALDDDERLILRLRFVEEEEPMAAARSLQMPIHTFRRREKKLMQKLRDVFKNGGLDI